MQDAYTIAQQEIQPGESLVWAGRPAPFVLVVMRWPVAATGAFFTLFAMIWLGIVLTMPFNATTSSPNGPPWPVLMIFPVFGLLFLTVGLALFLSPLWYWRKARHTVYVVTDSRALIIEPRKVQSFDPNDIQQLVRRDRGGGRGDLIFRDEQGNMLLAMYTFGMGATRKIGFYGVSDVRSVEDAIRKVKRSMD